MRVKVSKITPSSNGGFIVTVEEITSSNAVNTAFGVQSTGSGRKFSTKVLNTTLQVGQSVDIDLNNFNVVEREFTVDDPESENFGKSVTVHWLFPKTQK